MMPDCPSKGTESAFTCKNIQKTLVNYKIIPSLGWTRIGMPWGLAHSAHHKLMMYKKFFPTKAWTCKQMSHLWDSPLPSKSSSGDVVSCVRHTQGFAAGIWGCCRISSWKAQAQSMTNHYHILPTSCGSLWVSFLTLLKMSKLLDYLYWLANKLQVFFYVSRNIKNHKIAPFIPSHLHSSTLLKTQKFSQKKIVIRYCLFILLLVTLKNMNLRQCSQHNSNGFKCIL